MDEQNKPNARKKRVVGAGKGIEKQGEGLGIGPVGDSSKRPPQSAFGQQTSSPRSSGLHRARKAHSARYRILSDRVHSVPRKARSVLHRILSARADSDRNRLRSDKTDRSQIRSARASGPSRQRSVRHKAARAHSGLLPVRPGRVPAQDSGAAARPPWEAAAEN